MICVITSGGSEDTRSAQGTLVEGDDLGDVHHRVPGQPGILLERATLPGAAAKRWFEVMTAASTVLMRLALKESACTTTTGRRFAGSDAIGRPRSAQ